METNLTGVSLTSISIYMDNIRTLLANIKFICTSFRSRKKRESLTRFFFCFEASTNKLYISRQCTYIMFILQCRVVTKFFNLHTKRQKHLTCCLINYNSGISVHLRSGQLIELAFGENGLIREKLMYT